MKVQSEQIDRWVADGARSSALPARAERGTAAPAAVSTSQELAEYLDEAERFRIDEEDAGARRTALSV